MRISDWSSDVCSSDLEAIAAGLKELIFVTPDSLTPVAAEVAATQFDSRRRLAALVFRDVEQPFDPLDGGRVMSLGDHLRDRKLVQIGRASCRDRVCKYV